MRKEILEECLEDAIRSLKLLSTQGSLDQCLNHNVCQCHTNWARYSLEDILKKMYDLEVRLPREKEDICEDLTK